MITEEYLKSVLKGSASTQDISLSYEEKVAVNLIVWAKKSGMSLKDLRDWYASITRSPFVEDLDQKILQIIDKAIEVESKG